MSARIFGSLTLALTSVLWATVSFAQQDDRAIYEGSVSCEVRGVSAASIDEGQHQRLAGVVGLPNEGDAVVVDYSLGVNRLSNWLDFRLFAPEAVEEDSIFTADVSDIGGENLAGEKLVTRQTDRSFSIQDRYTEIRAAQGETIYLRSSRSALQLRRYYKADWQGMYIRHGFAKELAYVATLRCQQNEDALSTFSEQVIEVFGKE